MSWLPLLNSELEAELMIDDTLRSFVEDEVLVDLDLEADTCWRFLAVLVKEFAPRNRVLLAQREEFQKAIDRWHQENRNCCSPESYEAMLHEIGYLLPEGAAFSIDTKGVDAEIATISGPQLVVPLSNARYSLNAVNARWGSLYDALYGTNALGTPTPTGDYRPDRGATVIAWVRDFLDEVAPLRSGSHREAVRYRVVERSVEVELDDESVTTMKEPGVIKGYAGTPADLTSLILQHHGLQLEVVFDRESPIGGHDRAGIADVLIESAVTVVLDCEDSVAAVDPFDKVAVYRNLLQLMTGELTAEFEKAGQYVNRKLAAGKSCTQLDGTTAHLPSRALMMIRNVGLLMETSAVRDTDGVPIPEGILDGFLTVLCALRNLTVAEGERNSEHGSIYIVKPKLQGPAEAAFVDEFMSRVEELLQLPDGTVKIGLMDEERRTSMNLLECVRALHDRIAFINTGFLDRTGDEIHTSMRAGAMIRKGEMKSATWYSTYERNNMAVGLATGFQGRAQIGKGMWAAPDQMAAMLEEKIDQLRAGANCAWVPSPTAATIHAIHYHRIDVEQVRSELSRKRPPLNEMLMIPLADKSHWSDEEIRSEVENNAQGILGYVVRWVNDGIGCSKVPDIRNIDLMEDRATCRISSQHIANWLLHGVIDRALVIDVFQRMAAVVDAQNATSVGYVPMAPGFDGEAFNAALALVLDGREQPSGYTEPILHSARREHKTKESSG